MPQNDFVSIEEMNKYSLIIKEEIEKINERLNGISSLVEKDEKIAKLEEELANLRQYSNYLAESQNQALAYANYLGEKLDQSVSYSEHIAEKADRGIQYSEMVAEKMDKGLEYNNYIAEKLNQSINYSEHVATKLEENIKFGNYLAEKMNETVAYAEYIAEHTDNSIRYSEYITENVASKKDFQNLTEYAEHMFENFMPKADGKTADVSENNDGDLVSSAVKENVSSRYTDLDKKIEAVLESIKKQKIDEKADDARYPFVKFLGENKRNEFFALNETEKTRVTNALNARPSFNEEQIVKVWESALADVEVNEKWLTDMPLEYLPIWENATPEVKDRIARQARLYKLETPYQINNFWQTRGLGKTEQAIVESLNESKRVETSKTDANPLGYSTDHVKNVAAGLNRFNKR